MSLFPVTMFNLVLILMQCGDIESNPGPLGFCHLNTRSLISDVHLTLKKHQYSLLVEIFKTLVYRNEFDIIAISETWLTDNIPDTELDLKWIPSALL